MDREKIILFRNLFLRLFVIGIVFAILLFVATLAFWTTATGLVMHLFKVDEKELGGIVLSFFLNMRLIVLFLFLAPALALHWTAKKL
jgi:hypothetical protein